MEAGKWSPAKKGMHVVRPCGVDAGMTALLRQRGAYGPAVGLAVDLARARW